MYTIMTNAQSGKIALLAQTMKPEELKQNGTLPAARVGRCKIGQL